MCLFQLTANKSNLHEGHLVLLKMNSLPQLHGVSLPFMKVFCFFFDIVLLFLWSLNKMIYCQCDNFSHSVIVPSYLPDLFCPHQLQFSSLPEHAIFYFNLDVCSIACCMCAYLKVRLCFEQKFKTNTVSSQCIQSGKYSN